MKYIFFILAACLLLHSCTDGFFSQTVKIDPPDYDKQLSFHLLLNTNDSVVRLVMTRNFGIVQTVQDYEDWFVKGATAEIYENGQIWLTLTPLSADSAYVLKGILPHPLVSGNTYEIRASHPDFPAVRAVQLVPGDFQVDSVRVKHNALSGGFGDRLDLLDVFLQDQPGVKDYYEIGIFKRNYEYSYNPVTNTYDTIGIHEYPVSIDGYNDPNVQEGFGSSGLVSDQFFEGQAYKFQARYFSYSNGSEIDSSLTVRVRHVTEDFFKWSRSYQANYNNEENPLVEPVTIFHNLENGLGVFSISNEKKYVVE